MLNQKKMKIKWLMSKIKEKEKQKLIFRTVKEHNQHKEHKDIKQ